MVDAAGPVGSKFTRADVSDQGHPSPYKLLPGAYYTKDRDARPAGFKIATMNVVVVGSNVVVVGSNVEPCSNTTMNLVVVGSNLEPCPNTTTTEVGDFGRQWLCLAI